MGDTDRKSSQGSTGSTVLDNPQVYNLLSSRIKEQVGTSVKESTDLFVDRLIRILSLILSIVVVLLIAVGTVSLKIYVDSAATNAVGNTVNNEIETVKSDLEENMKGIMATTKDSLDDALKNLDARVETAVAEAVETAVAEAVETAVAEAVEAIRLDSEIAALNFRILNLDRSDRFTSEEAEAIIDRIDYLVKSGGEQVHSHLLTAIETAAKNFAAANRLELVMRLDEIAPDLLRESAIGIQTMIQASGYRLLGDAGAPGSWTNETGARREIYENYRTYADRAELAGYPELYLLYEMLLRYLEGRPPLEIGNLIQDADNLNEIDANNFIRIFIALATENVTVLSNAESIRVADRVAGFLCDYGEKGERLPQITLESDVRLRMDKICP